MMAYAGPSHLKSHLHMSLPDRPNRWSVDTDQSTPSTVHEMDFSKHVSPEPRDPSRDLEDPRDSGLDDDADEEVNPAKTLAFLESLQDKIADELRMLEWEMSSKDELLTEILGYKDIEKESDNENESENEPYMQSSLSSQSSWSDVGSKTMSEGVLADVETSGHTSPRSWSSNGSPSGGSHGNGDSNDFTVGNLTFFASNTQQAPQQACLDWYVKLLVNSVMRSVSCIFIDGADRVQWQNQFSDLHVYNAGPPAKTEEYIERPLRFSRRFTDSNIFFGDGFGGYYDYTSTDSYHGNNAYDWYSSTEDEWDGYYDNQTDGGIPPPVPWQAPWRRSRGQQPRMSEPNIGSNGFKGLVFENTNLTSEKQEEENPRMFHKVRFQMHDIHHLLSKLRNQIHGVQSE